VFSDEVPLNTLVPQVPPRLQIETAVEEEGEFSKPVKVSDFENYVEMALQSDLFNDQHKVRDN